MGGETAHVEYRREMFEEGLKDFSDFVEEAYGDDFVGVDGDLQTAVDTNRAIDVTYELADATIALSADGDSHDEYVDITVEAADEERAAAVKNLIVAKAEGDYDRRVEDGVVYTAAIDQRREASYDSVEPVVGIEHVLKEELGCEDGEISVRALDDDIDSRVGRIKRRYHDGAQYLAEASIDLPLPGDDVAVHITQQKSYGEENDVRVVVESDDTDLMDHVFHLIDQRYDPATQEEPDEAVSDIDIDMFLEDVDDVSLDDVGGLDTVKQQLVADIIHPLNYADEAASMGIAPSNGALFAGPPGTGKTLMARAIAAETDAAFYNVDVNKLLYKYVGETEQHIDAVFDHAEDNAPAVVFFDEADTAMPDRQQSDKEYTKSMTNAILRRLDGFDGGDDLVTIAATNLKDDMDPAGYRSGRMDAEYAFSPPDHDGRKEILDIKIGERAAQAEQDALFGDVDLDRLAGMADGATGADLEVWVEQAVRHAAYGEEPDLDRPPQVDTVTEDDFSAALAQLDVGSETGWSPAFQ